MLAGNVQAWVEDGDLLIRGDKLDNEIAITSGANAEVYAILGLNGTTINGGVINGVAPVTIGNITGNLDIDLGQGDDLLEIGVAMPPSGDQGSESATNISYTDVDFVEVPGSLLIRTGRGHDEIALFVDVGHDAYIETGVGDDSFFIDNSNIGGSLLVKTGSGDDNSVVATTSAESACLSTGRGHDNVLFLGAAIEFGLTVNTGAGDDLLVVGSSDGSQGDEDSSVGGDLAINTGSGNDHVELTGTFDALSVGQKLAVNTGAGQDSVFVSHVSVETEACFDFGAGDDDAIIDHLDVLDQLVARMGAGNDDLQITASSAASATLAGGSKRNTLGTLSADDEFANDFETLNVSTFEIEVID